MKSATDIFCTTSGSGLEPVRASHFSAIFTNQDGSQIDATSDYHLRKIDGLEQAVAPGTWTAINYQIPFPGALSPSIVTLRYMLLTTQGGDKKILQFWQDWRAKVYDFDNDMPALFNECAGSGIVRVLKPGPNPSDFLEFNLEGMWPMNVIMEGFDRESSDPMGFSVALSVAQIKPK